MIRSFYFAHPTTMYDTPAERALSQAFLDRQADTRVENPNQPQHSEGYQREGMDYFVHLCDRQDGVFFAPFADGSVGAGVVKEVESFLKRGVPVYEYEAKDNGFQALDSQGFHQLNLLDVDATRAHLKAERALAQQGQSPYASLESYRQSLNVVG